jgi:hypothetical protein
MEAEESLFGKGRRIVVWKTTTEKLIEAGEEEITEV